MSYSEYLQILISFAGNWQLLLQYILIFINQNCFENLFPFDLYDCCSKFKINHQYSCFGIICLHTNTITPRNIHFFSLFSSYFKSNHQHLSPWQCPGSSNGHFLVQTTIANHECSMLSLAFLKRFAGRTNETLHPLIPTPLWQFHGKIRLWSQPGPRRERKARKRRQRRRMSEKEQRRPHAGSTSDTKHLFLTTKRSLRSLTLPLVVILSSFFLILSTSSSQPMVTSGASSGERISVRKRRDRRRSIESRRRRRRLRESGRYAAPPPSAPCSPSAAR